MGRIPVNLWTSHSMVWVLQLKVYIRADILEVYITGGAGQLVVKRSETNHGEMAFSHYVTRCWNKLSISIRSAPTVSLKSS